MVDLIALTNMVFMKSATNLMMKDILKIWISIVVL